MAARVHHGLGDPAELLAKHDELARRYRAATGHAPLPVLSVADFCRWQDEETQLERERYGPSPVTWADAFVMLMGYTRAAYRPD